jgi:hypothetical protein
MSKERQKFIPGEFFIYKNGDRLELGKVKRMADEGGMAYYCWYSCGTTAARTPVELMLKLANNDGGPAKQCTLGQLQSQFIEDRSMEVEDYFSQEIIWTGLVRDLPEHLKFYPVEDSGEAMSGTWARICY